MLLSITAINEEGELREFSHGLDKLEVGFDFLSDVAGKGHTLLKVAIVDEGKVVRLPPEVFDGLQISNVIKRLEQEWTAILTSHSPKLLTHQEETQWIQPWLDLYEQQIVRTELMITRVDALLQRAKFYKEIGGSLTSRYESMLSRYSQHLFQAYTIRDRLLRHLEQL